MKETTNGFRIAEEDLKIRGPGEILGILQSGFPELVHADLAKHMDILKNVKRDINSILKKDKYLNSVEYKEIKNVLKSKRKVN
jgi:ATP-dependent DNA helicase RecG